MGWARFLPSVNHRRSGARKKRHMNRIKAIAVFTLLSGCSAGDIPVDADAPGADLGQTAEALTRLDIYGLTTEGVQGERCYNGHNCAFPRYKRYSITLDTSQCDGYFASDFPPAMSSAISYVEYWLSNEGWTRMSHRPRKGDSWLDVTLDCQHGDHGLGVNVDGYTQPPLTSQDCSGGHCEYSRAPSHLLVDHIVQWPFAAGTTGQRRDRINTMATHELGHSFGLAHCNCSTDSTCQVMDHYGCTNGGDPSTWSPPRNFTSVEKDAWGVFVP